MTTIGVEVIVAWPDEQPRLTLFVEAGTTARDAVRHAVKAGLDMRESGVDPDTAPLGVFGRAVADEMPLREGDRVELYRPLQQDPKEWRRRRARDTSDGSRQTRR